MTFVDYGVKNNDTLGVHYFCIETRRDLEALKEMGRILWRNAKYTPKVIFHEITPVVKDGNIEYIEKEIDRHERT